MIHHQPWYCAWAVTWHMTSEMQKKLPDRPPLPRLPFLSQPEQPASLQEHLQHLQQLLPKRVRWFYAEEKRWIPFGGADSMEIENVYRWERNFSCFRSPKCTTLLGYWFLKIGTQPLDILVIIVWNVLFLIFFYPNLSWDEGPCLVRASAFECFCRSYANAGHMFLKLGYAIT